MTRHYFVPDVPQTSSLENGLAALKCVLDGFDIPVSQRRLQEILQPAVQVTTLDRLEQAVRQLGLEAEQQMTPIDHFLLSEENIPAIVVARQSSIHPTTQPSNHPTIQPPNHPATHPRFLVVWRKHGPFFQVMDPAVGERLLTEQRLLDELEIQTRPMTTPEWRKWTADTDFSHSLRQRLTKLQIADAEVARLVDTALSDTSWRALATLDAATRAADVAVRAGGFQSGEPAGKMIAQLFEQARREIAGDGSMTPTNIPHPYWSVLPQTSPPCPSPSRRGVGERSDEQLLTRGVVFLRVHPPQPAPAEPASVKIKEPRARPRLPRIDLEKDPQFRAERELVNALRADGFFTPAILAIGLALAAGAVAIQALFLRSMMQIGQGLGVIERTGVVGLLLTFFVALALLELPIQMTLQRIGRRLETRLRVAFLEKIPRLSNRYFVDRPIADLNRRAYALRDLRETPESAAKFARAWFQLILTAGCMIWLEPTSLPFVLLSVITTIGIVQLAYPLGSTAILRCSLHTNTLNHFYLDALLGLLPARTHSAERAIRREHESSLVDLIGADVRMTQRFGVIFLTAAMAPAIWTILVVLNFVARGGAATDLILLTYWGLNLPLLAEQVARAIVQYLQRCRPAALMLSQVLDAPEETTANEPNVPNVPNAPPSTTRLSDAPTTRLPAAVSINFDHVSVRVGERALLSDIHLSIAKGEHVAIVGASGAGKTSLVGLVLGWHRPTTGQILMDDVPLEGERLYALRQETAWVDTAVQLWNRSLLDNLRYGTYRPAAAPLGKTIEQADLFNVLANLPNGLQTLLGESGRLVSGGEGQRVRLGRALFRSDVRLVILDEPFRALDRGSRRLLLGRARQHWRNATMIFISHDVEDVQGFDRVLVLESGRMVEDGVPSTLAAQRTSRYRALLESDRAAQDALWGSTTWRRFWLGDGKLSENGNGSKMPNVK